VIRPANRALRVAVAGTAVYLGFSLIMGIVLIGNAVHLRRRPLDQNVTLVAKLTRPSGAILEDVSMAAADGAVLKAWYVRPANGNGSAVILLHGMADNREGVTGFASMFLVHGYSVLLPDSRAHGESGGSLVTYGVLEREDVRRWVEWLRPRITGCVDLFGESMGGAIAVQTSAVTSGLCAVVAESSFATFRAIADDRIGQQTGLAQSFTRMLGMPMREIALLYARLRYGVNLADANPLTAIAISRVPTLLISGTEDANIPMRHSMALERAGRSHTQLWIVEGAEHTAAMSVNPAKFEIEVVGWFDRHRGSRRSTVPGG
jgi:fermentation-respiration switch protein FrsA (DUF1100 family)